MGRTLLSTPWEYRDGAIIIPICPYGNSCEQAQPYGKYGEGNASFTIHTDYRGHLLAETVPLEIGTYIVDLHNRSLRRNR